LYETRVPRQDYSESPQFAVIPRSLDGGLPTLVELVSFSIHMNRGHVRLLWSIARETNNFGFSVERKSTGQSDFQEIGFVRGKGTVSQLQTYVFIDSTVNMSLKYAYRLKQIDLDGIFEYSEELSMEVGAPTEFNLLGNYPNPFNPVTTISFEIPRKVKLTLKVYNIRGTTVRTILHNETRDPGRYSLPFDASGLPSGTYFYQLSAKDVWSKIGKMVLLK